MTCFSSRANRVEFFRLCSSETCQCANHCTLDFGDFGVLHGVHQCILGASRVALQLSCCVLLTEGCDQRGILQHLLRTLLLLLTGANRCSREVRNTGGNLLNCCAAVCLGICSAATMTCANGLTELSWLADWILGRGPELVLRYHVRVARITVVHWALGLHRPPTASPVELGTGVTVGVNRGPTRVALHPGRMMEEPERQPYIHWTTCYDYRGDVDYRRMFLHLM